MKTRKDLTSAALSRKSYKGDEENMTYQYIRRRTRRMDWKSWSNSSSSAKFTKLALAKWFSQHNYDFIKKKHQIKRCNDYKAISLLSHVRKIVACILNMRLEQRIEEVTREDQFDFRKGNENRAITEKVRIILDIFSVKKSVSILLTDRKHFTRWTGRSSWKWHLKKLVLTGGTED